MGLTGATVMDAYGMQCATSVQCKSLLTFCCNIGSGPDDQQPGGTVGDNDTLLYNIIPRGNCYTSPIALNGTLCPAKLHYSVRCNWKYKVPELCPVDGIKHKLCKWLVDLSGEESSP